MCSFARFAYGFALGRVKCWSGAKSDVVGMFPLDDVVVLVCGVHRCWYGLALIICRCRVRCMGCACV